MLSSASARSGSGVAGSGRVDGEWCQLSPAVGVDQFGEGPATDGPVVTLGSTDGDGSGYNRFVGDAEELAQLSVDEQIPRRHDPAVTDSPCRQKKVLAGRVDRGAFHRMWPCGVG